MPNPFSSTTWDNFGDQTSFINTGIEILHIDSNLLGTALIENGGVGYHFGGVSSMFDNPGNSLWFAMAAMLETIGVNEDEIILTGDEAQDFLDALGDAVDRGDITVTTTFTVDIPETSGTVRLCVETIFGCITYRTFPQQ